MIDTADRASAEFPSSRLARGQRLHGFLQWQPTCADFLSVLSELSEEDLRNVIAHAVAGDHQTTMSPDAYAAWWGEGGK